MTLADEDTNSIPTDNANMAIQGNVTMQVTRPGGHFAAFNHSSCTWTPSHALHCSNQGAHIFVHCYSIDKEQFCSEMGWKLLESMWRNSLSQSCKFYSKWHTVFFPDCIITAKCILLHHGNGLKLYWLEYQSVFRSNLPCTVFHGNALQRLQCAAWHTHSGNARAVCAQPSKPNWS